jgi:hypothetical protein
MKPQAPAGYGTQRIWVTDVNEACVATLAYSPTEAAPTVNVGTFRRDR